MKATKKIVYLVLTTLVISSCTSKSGETFTKSNTWRARNILNNHLLIVENDLELPLTIGDTVCVGNSHTTDSEFSILNSAQQSIDTIQYDMIVTNKDTIFTAWECHNVVLEQKVLKYNK
ncbi:MAG: hypothetical protein WCK31_04245 [bacterium]